MDAAVDTVLIAAVVVSLVVVLVVQPAARRARVNASLAAIAPLVTGNVREGRLYGTLGGYRLEAWPFHPACFCTP